MSKKFELEKIDSGIYRITEPWYKEHANLYLLEGEKFNLLIDCGLGLFNLNKFLSAKGFHNLHVALTHSHFDHAAGLKHFKKNNTYITPTISNNLQDLECSGLQYFNKNDILTKLPLPTFKTIKVRPSTLTQIDNGSFCFEIISLPGHTDDSTVYFEKRKGILITGDTLYDGTIFFDLVNSKKTDFKKSLEKISKLDFQKVLPGHNQIFNKPKALDIASAWMEKCNQK